METINFLLLSFHCGCCKILPITVSKFAISQPALSTAISSHLPDVAGVLAEFDEFGYGKYLIFGTLRWHITRLLARQNTNHYLQDDIPPKRTKKVR